MNSCKNANNKRALVGIAPWLLLATAATLLAKPPTQATNVVIWDTGSPLAGTSEAVAPTRSGWKAVPSELFDFESDPPTAASDPGYYGREYAFKGDAVIE